MTFAFANSTPIFAAQRSVFVEVNGTHIPDRHAGPPCTLSCWAPAHRFAVLVSGSKFRLVTEHGLYLVYSLHGSITFSVTAMSMTASRAFEGVIRVAKLAHPAHEHTLDTYAVTYPTGAELGYEVDGDCATLLFQWSIIGHREKFMHLSWPHHRCVLLLVLGPGESWRSYSKALQSPRYLAATSLSYLTIKGWMVPVVGHTWRLKYQLPPMDFHAPRPPDPSCVSAIIQGLQYEIGALGPSPEPGDFYFWGGSIAAVSRLA